MKKCKKLQLCILVLLLLFQLSACEYEETGGYGEYGTANVSPMVERWRNDVERIAAKNGVSEYVELLLAVIAQESGGNAERYPDIMQSSESAGNAPNTIDDPIESLEQGIQYFAGLVERGKEAGVDIETVLQSYNFGGGYIGYIKDNYNGKHSESTARAFSQLMASRLGWNSYGDVKYVEHVYSHMNRNQGGGTHGKYEQMYAVMQEYLGVPYLFGGTSKAGIDCSAMSQKIYQAAGISLPRTAQAQYDAVKHIPESQLQKGDLVFFTGTYNAGTYITHVGVYTGDNQFFHAGGKKCQFSELTGYYLTHLAGFGRN